VSKSENAKIQKVRNQKSEKVTKNDKKMTPSEKGQNVT